MPVHPLISSRFHHLDGVRSGRDLYTTEEGRERLRAFEAFPPRVPPPVVPTRAVDVPGPHGTVPVRLYSPTGTSGGATPCLVWLHGGGFAGGDLDMREADWTAREVCARAGATVVSVDYRLCVDGVHHPVPHDDTVAALRWVRDHADELGVDPQRISLGGASAGGALSAGAAVKVRDQDSWTPAALILVYAVLHPRVPAPSRGLAAALAELPALFAPPLAPGDPITENYLGGPTSSADGYAFAALAALDGLGPTLLVNAEYDHLRSSAEAFAAALALAGVDVRQVLVRGLLHGFLNLDADLEPVQHCLGLIASTVAAAVC